MNLYYNVKLNFFLLLVDLIILRHISWSHNFTPHYFNMYFLIEFRQNIKDATKMKSLTIIFFIIF
jgi:hypothetical protein